MLRFLFLGPLETRIDEKPLQFPTQKVALLLSYLVTNREHLHPRDVLAELFWGGASQERARNSLRQALSVLKKTVPTPAGQELLLTSSGALRFNPAIECELDLDVFNTALTRAKQQTLLDDRLERSLEEALLLYRGPFLSGFYEDWVLQEQLHWQDLFLEGSLQLAQHFEFGGAYQRAIEICRRALTFYPHHEVLSQLLMRALTLTGDRKAAMAQYDELVIVLKNELDIQPLPETRVLYEQIRDNQVGAHRRTRVSEVFKKFPKATPFVGRQEHLQQIMAKARLSREGSVQGVLLSGDPGIGKSRILREALLRLEAQDWLCLYAECLPISLSPFEPLVHALQGRVPDPERLVASLPDFARDEVLELIPAWGKQARASHPTAPDQVQRKRFLALSLLLEKLSQDCHVCIALDDLHWVDESTIRFTEFLFRRQQTLRIFWIGCCRDENLDSGHPLINVTEALSALGALEVLKVSVFHEQESRELIATIFKDTGPNVDNIAKRLVSLTQGNPLYLSELAFEVQEMGPPEANEADEDPLWSARLIRHLPKTLEAALNERLRRLSARGRALLNTGAVLGRRWAVSLAVAVSRQRRRYLIEAAKELMRFNLLQEHEDGFRFSHDLIREYVLLQLSSAERNYLHELAAHFLEKSIENTNENPAILAWHFQEGGMPGRAAKYWLESSKRSLQNYALRETLEFLIQAYNSLQETHQSRALLDQENRSLFREYWTQRAALHNFLGERESQRQAVEELEKIARLGSDEAAQLVAHLHHAHWALMTGNLSEAIREAENLRKMAVTLKNPAYERAALQELSMAYEHSGEYEKALKLVEEYQNQEEVPTDHLWIFDYTGSLYAYLGQFDKALGYYQRKLDSQQGSMDIYFEGEILTSLAIIYEHIGNYAASIQHLQRVLEMSEQMKDAFIQGRTLANLGSSCWGAGDYSLSFQFFEQALRIFEKVQHKRAQMIVKVNLGTVLGDLGNNRQAIEYFDSALPIIQAEGLKDLEIEVLWRKGIVLKKLNEHLAALRLSEQAVSKIEQGAHLQNPIRAYFAHSRILEGNGQRAQAKFYLKLAYDELNRQAQKILNDELRAMFLENIRDHKEIVAAWETHNRS